MARTKVVTVPTLKAWDEVDIALRDIHEIKNSLAEMNAEQSRRINAVKAEFSATAMPLHNRMNRLAADIEEYVAEHRAELSGKQRVLTFGIVGYHASSELVVPAAKLADIIITCKAMGLLDCINIKETLDKKALKDKGAEIVYQTGAYIKQKDVFYYDVDDCELVNTTANVTK